MPSYAGKIRIKKLFFLFFWGGREGARGWDIDLWFAICGLRFAACDLRLAMNLCAITQYSGTVADQQEIDSNGDNAQDSLSRLRETGIVKIGRSGEGTGVFEEEFTSAGYVNVPAGLVSTRV